VLQKFQKFRLFHAGKSGLAFDQLLHPSNQSAPSRKVKKKTCGRVNVKAKDIKIKNERAKDGKKKR